MRAAAGGDIALPATLAAPQTDSTINTLLDAGVLSGAFTTVNMCIRDSRISILFT